MVNPLFRRHAYRFPGGTEPPTWTPCRVCGAMPESPSHVVACDKCLNSSPDSQGQAGHLKLNPKTGATELVEHDEIAVA